MKTFFALLIFLVGTINLLAQPQLMQGVYSASGSLQFSSTSSEFQNQKITMSVFSLSPSVSLFVFDRVELSVGPSYTHSTFELTPSIPPFTSTATSLAIRIGGRYYFVGETFVPFVGVEGGVSWSKYSNVTGSPPFSPPLKIYTFQVGADYFVTQHFAIEPSVQYGGTTTPDISDKTLYVSIGVKYFVL